MVTSVFVLSSHMSKVTKVHGGNENATFTLTMIDPEKMMFY